MNAPVRSLFALGAAFAAGVVVTTALVAPKADKPTVQTGKPAGAPEAATHPKTAMTASLAPSSRASESSPAPQAGAGADKWIDPVKQPTPAPTAKAPLPPLVFHLGDKQERSNDGDPRESKGNGEGPARDSVMAQVPPPRRPKASELIAKQAEHRGSTVASAAMDRVTSSPSTASTPPHTSQAPHVAAKLHRRAEGARLASADDRRDDASLAPEKSARRAHMMRRQYAEIPQEDYPASRFEATAPYQIASEARAPERVQRSPSSQPSGVMRWLDEP